MFTSPPRSPSSVGFPGTPKDMGPRKGPILFPNPTPIPESLKIWEWYGSPWNHPWPIDDLGVFQKGSIPEAVRRTAVKTEKTSQGNEETNGLCRVHVGDEILPSYIYRDYFINHEIRIPLFNNQDSMESTWQFFVTFLGWLRWLSDHFEG